MRSPLAAFRDFRSEFGSVMREHEDFLLEQLAPSDEAVAAARRHRAGPGPTTAVPEPSHLPNAAPAAGSSTPTTED